MISLHDILIDEVCGLPKGDVALLLSSGIDSQSLLFAMLECGIYPHVYSFTLEDRESHDFLVAQSLAKEMGVRFTKIALPLDKETLIRDCFTMARKYGARKKTDFECLWPFLYVYQRVEERVVVTGIPADGHFALSKKAVLHYKDDVEAFREGYFRNPNAGQRLMRGMLASEWGRVNVDPYYSEKIATALRGLSWDELNKPKEKMPIRRSFERLMSGSRHTNLQLGDSGISQHFETLHEAYKGHKSVVGIYNEIVKQANDAQVQLRMDF